jgi:hypothetical protein
MWRRSYEGARALRPGRDQPAKTIGNVGRRQWKLFCHWPCAVCSPGGVVDNAAYGALTLWVGSSGTPDPPPAHLHRQARYGVRYSAVSTSSGVAGGSLASCDRNTSGGNHKEFVRTRPSDWQLAGARRPFGTTRTSGVRHEFRLKKPTSFLVSALSLRPWSPL